MAWRLTIVWESDSFADFGSHSIEVAPQVCAGVKQREGRLCPASEMEYTLQVGPGSVIKFVKPNTPDWVLRRRFDVISGALFPMATNYNPTVFPPEESLNGRVCTSGILLKDLISRQLSEELSSKAEAVAVEEELSKLALPESKLGAIFDDTGGIIGSSVQKLLLETMMQIEESAPCVYTDDLRRLVGKVQPESDS